MTTELTLMRLMCAKICHDLAAPASAVAMGLEMWAESPQDASTRDLMHFSVQSIISKLELFRGLTGFSDAPNKPTGREIEKALRNYWPDNKITTTWQTSHLESLQGPLARLALAALLAAADGLPRGGNLIVSPTLSIAAQGPSAFLSAETIQALTGEASLSRQTVNTIAAFLAHLMARSLGGSLQIEASYENQFQIQFITPPQENWDKHS